MAEKGMFSKLEELETKYEDLIAKLSDPEIISNQVKLVKFSKEQANLGPIIETYRKYKKVLKDLEGSREIIQNEKDEELLSMAKAEIDRASKEQAVLEAQLQKLLLPKDPNDEKNILLEIRAGTGGDESALFAADLIRMYTKFAEKNRWRVEILSSSPTGLGGFKEIIAMINGENVYSKLKYESGVHRVQRVPETETQGRIHTSACTVAVLPEAEEIDIKINPQDLRIDVYRSSGPGGQSVNTTDSAVRITHIPTGLVVAMQDEKSQHKNKDKALKVLKTRLYDKMLQEQESERAAERKSMIGTGDRSERIRTYNFPQGRLTDHRIGLTLYRLSSIMDGDIEEIVNNLITHYQSLALNKGSE